MGSAEEDCIKDMTTFSHGIVAYFMLQSLLCSVVLAFAAVPDISSFDRMKTQTGSMDDNFDFAEKDQGRFSIANQDRYPALYQRSQYGKAAQSNDRLRSAKRGHQTNMGNDRRYRKQIDETRNRNIALVRKWYSFLPRSIPAPSQLF